MKKILSFFAILSLISSFTYGQWSYVKDFCTLKYNSGCHGLTVTPDGKIWVGLYATSSNQVDSIVNGTYVKYVNPIIIYNPDGTEFKRIKTITVNGVTDTLVTYNAGMRAGYDGNVYASIKTDLYKINGTTYEGMAKCTPVSGAVLTQPAVDGQGSVYTSQVLYGNPVMEWASSDLSFVSNSIDVIQDYRRTLHCTKDGLTLYIPCFGTEQVYVATRPDAFSSFSITDSLFAGAAVECLAWHPTTGHLWFSGGNYMNVPTSPNYSPCTWYDYNMDTKQVVDSIKWVMFEANADDERPRGLAFSPDGKTAYIGCFGSSKYNPVQEFKYDGGTGVKKENSVVKSFALSQNYPNPFNPTTKISFSVPKDGNVSLKVYNMLGQEVATLVNKDLSAGTYTANFDASKLSSGAYIYELKSNSQSISKKMLLMK